MTELLNLLEIPQLLTNESMNGILFEIAYRYAEGDKETKKRFFKIYELFYKNRYS